MPKVNLNKQDIDSIIDCLNDVILRSSSDIKIRQLDYIKTRLLRAREEKDKESPNTKKPKGHRSQV